MHRKFKSLGNFEFVTSLPTEPKSDPVYSNKSQEELKEIYNKIFNENLKKLKKAEKLKEMVQRIKQETQSPLEIKGKTGEIAELLTKIKEKDEDVVEEKNEQSVLLHKKGILKAETDRIRGSLIELEKNFEKATSGFDSFNKMSFSSKFAMISSNVALEKCGKHFDQSNNVFKLNSEILKRKLKTASDQNTERLKKTSSLDLEADKKKITRKKFCRDYEVCLNNLFRATQNKELSQELLKTYKEGFSVIRDFVDKDCQIQDFPDKRLTQNIIKKLKELEFRSESLNLNYQDLSEQEARFRTDLVFLQKELKKLKNTEIEAKNFLENKANDSLESAVLRNELLIINIFFQLAEGLYGNFEKLSYVQCSEKELEEKISSLISFLKKFRIGVQKRKPFDIGRFVIEKIAGKNNYFEKRMEIFNSTSLSPNEIKNTFLEVFRDDAKNSKIFVKIIKDSPILKIFIDKESLQRYCRNSKSKDFRMVLEGLSSIGNTILTDRLNRALIEVNDFFLYFNKKYSIDIRKNPSQDLENEIFIPIPAYLFRSRSQLASPYKVSEKNLKKSDSSKPDPPNPEKKESQVLSKSNPRLYSLSKTAINRQKIMKEFLENQKKEILLRSTEKKISKTSQKFLELPYIKKFLLKSSLSDRVLSSKSSTMKKTYN